MQAFAALREVKTGVEKIRVLREKSKKEALDYLIVDCKVPKEVQPRIEQTLEYFTIMPVSYGPERARW